MKQLTFIISFLFLTFGYQVFAQMPDDYYDDAIGLSGDELKQALHNIIKNHTEYSYDGIKAILKETDEDPNNSNNVILLYTGWSLSKSSFGGGADDWNREHVWAKSHGDFGNSPPSGTDVHHIRPTDASVNSARGNKDFDEGGQQHSEATGCYYTDDTWEPRDAVKGDVARMIFYMDVRYEGGSGELDLEVVDYINTSPDPEHGKFSTLMEWHEMDPPDDFEEARNETIYSYQDNRNPFIDHPEFADQIWNPSSTKCNENKISSVNIYPNPVIDKLFVELGLCETQTVKVNICDIFGRQIIYDKQYTNKTRITLNTQNFQKGIYFISITSNKETTTKKFQVTR